MRLKNIFRKERKHKPRKCGYSSVEECPYSSMSECNFDKTDCLLSNSKRKKHKGNNSLWPIIAVALIGLLIYIIVTIISKDDDYSFSHSQHIYNILSGISLSVITGAILAIVIDLPSRLKDYEASFVNALSSNNYLKSLDENRLTKLRNDITEQLHKTKAPNMAKGLIQIDQRICELLRQPYYSRYRHTVVCENDSDPNYIRKEHLIEYKLINPYSVNQTAVEFIKFTNLILVKDGESPESITDLKIFCSIDNKPEHDLSDRIRFQYEDIQNEFYNKKITITENNDDDNSPQKGIRVDFDDNIEVKMRYIISVHKSDPCFTKRLQHPVKNFRLDYTYNDEGIKLYGQIFGNEIKQSDISIKHTNNSVSLETFDWLLPNNGAIVVMLKK